MSAKFFHNFLPSKCERMSVIATCLKRFVLEFFPNLCPLCGRNIRMGELICSPCRSEIDKSGLSIRYETNDFVAYFYGRYDSKLRDLILAYKDGKHWRLSNIVALLLAKLILRYPTSAQLITWVPSNRIASEERGFETMQLVARKLSKILDIPSKKLLETKARFSCYSLPGKDRSKLITGMIYSVNHVKGDIILIDDVFSTGTTVEECVTILKSLGAKNITVYCLALADESMR